MPLIDNRKFNINFYSSRVTTEILVEAQGVRVESRICKLTEHDFWSRPEIVHQKRRFEGKCDALRVSRNRLTRISAEKSSESKYLHRSSQTMPHAVSPSIAFESATEQFGELPDAPPLRGSDDESIGDGDESLISPKKKPMANQPDSKICLTTTTMMMKTTNSHLARKQSNRTAHNLFQRRRPRPGIQSQRR